MQKESFYANDAYSVHLLYNSGQFSSILDNQSIISVLTARERYHGRRFGCVPILSTAVRIREGQFISQKPPTTDVERFLFLLRFDSREKHKRGEKR